MISAVRGEWLDADKRRILVYVKALSGGADDSSKPRSVRTGALCLQDARLNTERWIGSGGWWLLARSTACGAVEWILHIRSRLREAQSHTRQSTTR